MQDYKKIMYIVPTEYVCLFEEYSENGVLIVTHRNYTHTPSCQVENLFVEHVWSCTSWSQTQQRRTNGFRSCVIYFPFLWSNRINEKIKYKSFHLQFICLYIHMYVREFVYITQSSTSSSQNHDLLRQYLLLTHPTPHKFFSKERWTGNSGTPLK